MKILNLYAGIGGNRKLWGNDHEITAIEYNESIAAIYKDLYPNDNVIVADAHQYLLDHYKEYEDGFIWSSPPCPTHSRLGLLNVELGHAAKYPDMKLYQEIIFLQQFFYGKYCVENVKSYYVPLIMPQESGRHYFWCPFKIRDIHIDAISVKGQTGLTANIRMKAAGELILNWHGFDGDKRQLFKNRVEPEIGLHIFNQALGIIEANKSNQKQLFE